MMEVVGGMEGGCGGFSLACLASLARTPGPESLAPVVMKVLLLPFFLLVSFLSGVMCVMRVMFRLPAFSATAHKIRLDVALSPSPWLEL